MIKNFMFPAVIGLTALMACISYAEDKNYVQLSSGASFASAPKGGVSEEKIKLGNVYSVEVGRKIADRVRVGLEFSHRDGYRVYKEDHEYNGTILLESRQNTFKYKSSAAMINFSCDVASFGKFTPYALLGVGISKNKIKEDALTEEHFWEGEVARSARSKNTINLAYKVGVGVNYSLNSKVSLDVRYQFVNLGKIKLRRALDDLYEGGSRTALSGKLKSKEVMFGISYKF